MRRLLFLLPLSAILLIGCGGGKTVQADGAAQSLREAVSGQTGFRPSSVSCPSGIDAVVGASFDCRFNGPDGPYVAHLTIKGIQGDSATFQVKSRRSGAAAP